MARLGEGPETRGSPQPRPPTWKAFLVVGLIFPLHIVAGLFFWPLLLAAIARGSTVALLALLVYLPTFLYPAQRRFPGWKGSEWFWRWSDYDNTCEAYFGTFGLHFAEENIDPEQQYFVASHPHGTVIFQRCYWRSKKLGRFFQKHDWRMLGVSVLFRIPIVREISLIFGAVNSDKATCERLLRAGTSLVVFPGGLDEANTLGSSSNEVHIKTRTGFIRLAVKHGVPVLPTFTFGELDAVDAVALLPQRATDWAKKKLRVSTTFFAGRWGTFVPKRVPFNMCVGKPVAVTKLDETDAAFDVQVARVHDEYKAELRRLYQDNKRRFGYEHRPLVFI